MYRLAKSKKQKRINLIAGCILIPAMIHYFITNLIPIIGVFFLSVTEWNGINFSTLKWAGGANFVRFFTEPDYVKLLFNTALMGSVIVVSSLLISFLVAVMLVKEIRFKRIYRTIWYLPVLAPMAVVAQLFNALLQYDGVLNTILVNLGGKAVIWQDSAFWMYFFIIFLCVWKGLGTSILLFLAGLTSVPKELYEAADIDGATSLQKMFRVTVPMIRNMTGFILTTSLIGVFGIFEPVQLVSNGGPDGATKVVMFQIYYEAFENFNMGFSSAISVVVTVIVLVITFVCFRFTGITLKTED